MPRPRTQPGAGQPDDDVDVDAPAGVSLAGGLPVEPGPAVRTDGRDDPPAEDAPTVIEVLPAEAPGLITAEDAALLLRAIWGVAHHATRLTGGPDDAFQPTAAELREQAAPLAVIAARYPWFALVIQKSPYIAAAVAIGGYGGVELERVADVRRGIAPPPAAGPSPVAPPAPATFVRGAPVQPPREQVTEHGIGLRDAPRPGPVPTVRTPG